MKLIIDIPEEVLDYLQPFKEICYQKIEEGTDREHEHMLKALYEGIPLEDVKAEIAEEVCLTDNPYTKETKHTIEHSKLLDILDRIGKESEADFPQAKDIEPTVKDFSKVLDSKLISDAIQDCGADMKGKSCRCNTCKNNDDEFSGECYECIKGIFDHCEPEEIKTEVKHGRTND